jgi:hypothetical protein
MATSIIAPNTPSCTACKRQQPQSQTAQCDDDVLNEDWIIYRMVRSRRLLSLVLVAIGVGRRIQKGK